MCNLIFVSCGTGIATSGMMASQIEKALNEANINHSISKYTVREVAAQARNKKPKVIITSSNIPGDVDGIPVVDGKPLITNIGKEKTLKEIIEYLK